MADNRGFVSTNQVAGYKSIFARGTTSGEFTIDVLTVINNVLAASTANLVVTQIGNRLIAGAVGALTLDGVGPFIIGQNVLIKDQALPEQNGVYTVVHPGDGGSAFILVRDVTFKPIVRSTLVYVINGATQSDTLWVNIRDQTLVINVDPILFINITGGGGGGGITNAANVGGFVEVFQAKVGTILNFRTLQAGPGITITQNANDILFEAAGSADTASNIGGFAEVFSAKVVNDFQFRTLQAGTNISITQNASDLLIDNTGPIETASNIGGFAEVFAAKVADDFQFRTLQAGTNIGITQNANNLLITNTAAADTASNIGGFVGVFSAKVGNDFQFKTLQAGTNVTITDNGNDIEFEVNSTSDTASNIGGFAEVFAAKVANDFQFRTLQAGTGIGITQNANNLLIDNTGPVETASNIGGFAEVFAAKVGDDFQFRTLQAGTNISITQNANNLLIDNTGPVETASNIGGFAEVFAAKVADDFQFRTLQAGAGISITQNANDLLIANSAINRIAYVLSFTLINVNSINPTVVAYFPWTNARYSGYTNGTVLFEAVISGVQEATVELYNITAGASLGSVTTAGTGFYSFAVANPGANARLAIRVTQVGGSGTPYPQIYGIVLEYDQ